jgi:hypothetical protein
VFGINISRSETHNYFSTIIQPLTDSLGIDISWRTCTAGVSDDLFPAVCSIKSSHLTVAVTISAVWFNVPSGPAALSDDLSHVLVTRGSVPVVVRRIGWMLSGSTPSTSTVNLLDYNDPSGYRFRIVGAGIPDPIDNSIPSRLYVAIGDTIASWKWGVNLENSRIQSSYLTSDSNSVIVPLVWQDFQHHIPIRRFIFRFLRGLLPLRWSVEPACQLYTSQRRPLASPKHCQVLISAPKSRATYPPAHVRNSSSRW